MSAIHTIQMYLQGRIRFCLGLTIICDVFLHQRGTRTHVAYICFNSRPLNNHTELIIGYFFPV